MERDENERASDVALPDENEARLIGEIVASLMVEIEKSGGSNATPSRHQSSADAFMGGAYALRDEIHCTALPNGGRCGSSAINVLAFGFQLSC